MNLPSCSFCRRRTRLRRLKTEPSKKCSCLGWSSELNEYTSAYWEWDSNSGRGNVALYPVTEHDEVENTLEYSEIKLRRGRSAWKDVNTRNDTYHLRVSKKKFIVESAYKHTFRKRMNSHFRIETVVQAARVRALKLKILLALRRQQKVKKIVDDLLHRMGVICTPGG